MGGRRGMGRLRLRSLGRGGGEEGVWFGSYGRFELMCGGMLRYLRCCENLDSMGICALRYSMRRAFQTFPEHIPNLTSIPRTSHTTLLTNTIPRPPTYISPNLPSSFLSSIKSALFYFENRHVYCACSAPLCCENNRDLFHVHQDSTHKITVYSAQDSLCRTFLRIHGQSKNKISSLLDAKHVCSFKSSQH